MNKNLKNSSGFLVAISASPYSQYLIKWTCETAAKRKSRWLAVYIQTERELTKEENELLKRNLDLVNQLGGELIISMDDDVPAGIMRVAARHSISHIVIGKPLGYKPALFRKKDIIKTLIKLSGETDIFVISEQSIRAEKKPFFLKLLSGAVAVNIRGYLLVSVWLLLLVVLNLFLFNYINYLSVGFIFLAAVTVVSLFCRRGPVLYFAALSAVLWNFLFLQPRFTVYIDHLEDLFMFLMYFLSAFIIGNLTTRLRLNEAFLRKREKNLEELYRMSKVLNESGTKDEIIQKSTGLLKEFFSAGLVLYLNDENNSLSMLPFNGSDFALSDDDWKEAFNVFENRQTLFQTQGSGYCYIPLLTGSIPLGVLAMNLKDKGDFTVEQQDLLTTLVSQMTAAIERNEYNITQQKIKLAEESEKLYQILLNSVSHELRTPITTIATSANGLIDDELGKNVDVRKIFADDIIEAADRLNRIVDNLLGSLKMESGRIMLNLEWYDVSELVSAAVKKMGKILKKHKFTSSLDNDLPAVKFDFRLMEQLLTNLLYNAIMYTPEDTFIHLNVRADNDDVVISIDDSGPGISAEDKEKIFDKFYRSRRERAGGLGLGLSICREIAEIHKGTIIYEKSRFGGACFTVRLPLQRDEIKENYSE
ncbi:MAG: DUF4118 domain-containing protein [Spirochaetes bacterium]|nr:DUF4118 domain-containing protein [Spirochaetota bacterium]